MPDRASTVERPQGSSTPDDSSTSSLGPGRFALLICVAWIALLWFGSQVPQAQGPLAQSDGMARADWIAIVGLGFHHLSGSLVTWILTLALFGVWLSTIQRPSDVDKARLASVRAQIARHPRLHYLRPWSGLCCLYLEDRRRSFGRFFAMVALGLALGGWLWAGHGPKAQWLEVDPKGQIRMANWDAGRLMVRPAIVGKCSEDNKHLNCRWRRAEQELDVQLQQGQSSEVSELTFHWVASRVDPDLQAATVRWRGDESQQAPWYVFGLRAKRSVRVDSLQRRLTLITGPISGPAIVSEGGGKTGIVAPNGLLPGQPQIRMLRSNRHLLRVEEASFVRFVWMLSAIFFGLGGLLLASARDLQVRMVRSRLELNANTPDAELNDILFNTSHAQADS